MFFYYYNYIYIFKFLLVSCNISTNYSNILFPILIHNILFSCEVIVCYSTRLILLKILTVSCIIRVSNRYYLLIKVHYNIVIKILTFPLKPALCSRRASGAVKAGVPAVEDKKSSVPSNSLQTPRSAIWMRPLSLRSKLAGLISR